MDRHDLAEQPPRASPRRIARTSRSRVGTGVRSLTYRFDPERCTGFCLVDAPNAATAEQVHREAHGQIANAIVPVDLAAVQAFLGRIGDPRGAPGVATKIDAGRRAVTFTDIVGSTEMTWRLDDRAALELLHVHDALVRRGLAAHDGREVKHTADGIMASFAKAAEAVRAAGDIQRRFAAYNVDAAESLSVRIGIHAGEPVDEHNDLFRATVQLAFRLCTEPEADDIVVSGLVREMCDEDAARFVPSGERRIKGFAEKTPVFRYEWRQ
jgi:class 3 adenylate cyclase